MPKKQTPDLAVRNNLKIVLLNKYRDLLIDKMTHEDLEELQKYVTRQYDREHGWNAECRRRFEQKLRMYMHEEVLIREIAGIETLLPLLTKEDLRKGGARRVPR